MIAESNLVPGRFTRDSAITKNLGICQEQLRNALEVYSQSLTEAEAILAYVDGDHYNIQTLRELHEAGRPAEQHNLILRIQRLISGYFAKVITTAIGEAVTLADTETVNLHNEHFKLVQRVSNWSSVVKEITEDALAVGQGAWEVYVENTGRYDYLQRPIVDIKIKHIDARRVLIDPKASLPDKSDARFLHVWEYLTHEDIAKEFGTDVAKRLEFTHSEQSEWMDFSQVGLYNNLQNYEFWKNGVEYFVVRTYRKHTDPDGQPYITMTTWHGDTELGHPVTLDTKMFPVQTIPILQKKAGKRKRFYSPLYEALPSQDAINQALLQFQKLIGEHRVIADKRALANDEVQEFNKKLKTIGEVLFVRNIQGIKIEKLTPEAQAHINKMYTSIQLILEVLGINEAFLGVSKAGDSGRKFEGQRDASENTLMYLATPLRLMYVTMYKQIVHFSGVYKQAEEYLRFEDEFGQERWELVNEPFLMPTGDIDEEGLPVVEPITALRRNHSTGRMEVVYINERAKGLSDINVEVNIHTAPYDDTDAVELAFLEGLLNGQAGAIIANAHPAGIPYLYSLAVKHLKTRNSEKIAVYLRQLAQQLGNFNMQDPRLYDRKSFGASGGQGNAVSSGAGEMGTQGTQSKAIQFAGGTINDNKPEGYNNPHKEK